MDLRPLDHDAIRHAIDLSLDATVVPDATIEGDAFHGAARDDLLELDANAFTYAATSDEYRRAQRALWLLIAARLAPAVPAITQVTVGDVRFSRAAPDYAKRAAELRAEAAAEVAAYTEADGLLQMPSMFTRAAGTRGR